jgi:hypothetical protein
MLHAGIPSQYWHDIFESVVFIINSIPSSYLNFSTPYNTLFQKNPDYSFFKVLGCKCYPYLRPYTSHKLVPRSVSCVFFGYPHTLKGINVLICKLTKYTCQDIFIFDENSFPFKLQSLSPTPSASDAPSSSPLVIIHSPSSELMSTSSLPQTDAP